MKQKCESHVLSNKLFKNTYGKTHVESRVVLFKKRKVITTLKVNIPYVKISYIATKNKK